MVLCGIIVVAMHIKGLIRIVIYKMYVITVFLTTPKYHILDRQQYTIITVRDSDSYIYIFKFVSIFCFERS